MPSHSWIRKLFAQTPVRKQNRRLSFERCEDRITPATFSEVGTALILDLNTAGEAVVAVTDGTSYTFSLTGGVWAGVDTPNVSGFGSTDLTVTAAGLVAFDTINTTDSATNTSFSFGNSLGSSFSDNFNVALDNIGGPITLAGVAAFGANNLSLLTTGAVVNSVPVGTTAVTANRLALSAGTGVGTSAAPMATAVNNLEATTGTGGVFVANAGALTVGGVNNTLSGVRVTGASGAVAVSATGTMTINEVVAGPGNVTLTTTGGSSDLIAQHGISGGIQSGATLTISTGRNATFGTASGFGDVSGQTVILTAGGDVVVDATTYVQSQGAGGLTVAAGGDFKILQTFGAGSVANSNSGGAAITITTGAGRSIVVDAGSNGGITANNGNITLNTDDVVLTSGGVGTSARVAIAPVSVGRKINLGTNTAGSLSLTDAELDRITAGMLVIGNANSGAITSSAEVSPANAPILHLITGAKVLDGNSVGNNILATSLAVEAVAGIALDIVVTNLAAKNTTSGAIAFGDVTSGTALTIGTLDGVVGIANTGGAVSVVNNQATITVNQNVTSTGDLTIRTLETPGPGQDLIVAANTTISGKGIVTVRGGDNVTFNSGVSIVGGSVLVGVIPSDGQGTFDFSGATVTATTTAEIVTEQTVTLGAVVAGTTAVILVNNGGTIVDGNAAALNVTALGLAIDVRGAGNIGSGNAIDTKVNNLEIRHGANGSIAIANDSAALELGEVAVPGGYGTFSGITGAYNQVTIANTGSIGITSTGDTVRIDGDASQFVQLTGSSIVIGTSVTGLNGTQVRLTATTGSITSSNGGAADVVTTTGIARLSAATNIGSDPNPINLTVQALSTSTVVSNGPQFLRELDTLNIDAADLVAGAGIVTLSGGIFLTSASGFIPGPVAVASGATLGGVGTTGAASVVSGGTLSPGSSPGIINTGDLTLVSGAIFRAEVNGNTAGTLYDQVNATGVVNLGGATLTASGTIASSPGQTIVLIANDGTDAVKGTFAGLPEGSLVTINGVSFILTYNGGDGNDVALVQAITTTTATIVGGNLVITDADGTKSNDFTLSFDGTNYTLSDANGHRIDATGIAIGGNRSSSVVIDGSLVTGTIALDAVGGDDTITISGGIARTLSITGGSGTDTIVIGGTNTFVANANLTLAAESVSTFRAATVTVSGTGVLRITANDVDISATSTLGASVVTIVAQTVGRPIQLGSEIAGSLSLTDAELDSITAGTLNIGDANSGDITVSAAITRPTTTNVALVTAGDIVISGGQIQTGGGTLLLDSGVSPKAIRPTNAGTDATARTVTFGSDLAIVINGTTPDTQYTQLNVAGTVDLTGVDLVLSGTQIPVGGQVFTIVSATDLVGTFNGLANNAIVTFGGRNLIVNYTRTAVTLSVKPIVTLTVSANTGSEAGTTAITVTATADGPVIGDQTVTLIVTGTNITTGDATVATQITILSGQTTGSTTFTVVDDSLDEGSETATLTISNPSAGIELGTTLSQDITIADNDIAGIVVTPTSGLITTEVGGTATFTVVLTAQPTADVTITLTSSNTAEGTVVASLTFTAANWNLPQTVTVTGVDDAIVDGNIGYTIVTGTASSTDAKYNGINPADVTLTNTDNDTATLSISAPAITETNGDRVVSFTVTLDRAVAGGFTVAIASALGTAKATDFTLNTSTLDFTGTAGETRTVSVTITGDTIVEGDETFTITTGAITNTALATSIATNASATGTIANDDRTTLTITGQSKPENSGPITFTVTSSNAVEGGFTVDFATLNGIAGASDFTAASGKLTFAGSTNESQTFAVTLLNDAIVEATETFTASLSNVVSLVGNSFTLPSTATGTITNDDATSATLTANSATEGNAITFTVTLTQAVDVDVTFTLTPSVGSASASDFAIAPQTVTILAGQLSGRITIATVDDAIVEGNETFTGTLSALNLAGRSVTIAGSTATATLTDNDRATLSISAPAITETNGDRVVSFTVTLDRAVAGGFTVAIASALGTAKATDFTLNTSTLDFTGTAGETRIVSVTITGDTIVQGDETFTITTGAITNTALATSIATNATATGTIVNDDRTTLTITGQSKPENAGPITFIVTSSNAVEGGFTVDFATLNGIAGASDFTAASGKLTFAGSTNESQTFAVTLLNDAIVEATETFTASLSNVVSLVGNSFTLPSAATGTITNDDIATVPPVVPPVVPPILPTILAATPDSGANGSQLRVIDPVTGKPTKTFDPFPGFGGTLDSATGDLTGDGIADIVIAAGPGGGPHVKVFDGVTGAEVQSFFAYATTFRGGVNVAVGDVNGDGIMDIITSAGPGGGPHVQAFSGRTGEVLYSFYAYDASFVGGVEIAVGDVTGDGFADIVTGAGLRGGSQVKVFSGATGAEVQSLSAYAPTFLGGVNVAVGDINGDGFADIITGAGAGGGPHVKVFNGRNGDVLASFYAYDEAFTGGVDVSAVDVNGDGIKDIVTGAGPGGGPHVKVFSGTTFDELENFFALDSGFRGGVNVG